MEREDLHNYRPISNIPFVAKLLERVVATRMLDHCREQDLLDENQSAAIFVLLDFSAAFDTVDRHVLLQTFEEKFRVSGDALWWFQTYLSWRTQSIVVNNIISRKDKYAKAFRKDQS